MSRHDTIYNSLLGAIGFLLLLGGVGMFTLSQSPDLPPESRWVFRMSMAVGAAYALAAAVTLVVRFKAPAAARRTVTMAMNVVLLLYFPLGTALGIYGLWKVDRAPRPPPPLPREGTSGGAADRDTL